MFNDTIKDLFDVNIHTRRSVSVDGNSYTVDGNNEILSFDNDEYLFNTQGKTELYIENSPHVLIENIHGYKIIDIMANEIVINDEIVATKHLVLTSHKITVNRKIHAPKISVRPGTVIRVLNPESDLKNITDESYFVYTVPASRDAYVVYTIPEGMSFLDMVKPKIDPNNMNEVLCELLRRIFPLGENIQEPDADLIKLLEDSFVKTGKLSKEEIMENIGKYFDSSHQPESIKVSVHGKTPEEVIQELNDRKAEQKSTIVEDNTSSDDKHEDPSTTNNESSTIMSPPESKTIAKTIHKGTPRKKGIVLVEE